MNLLVPAVNEEKRQEPPNPQAPPDSEENRVAAAKKVSREESCNCLTPQCTFVMSVSFTD